MATNSKPAKYVYQFGNKKADGNGSMKPLLGGKGANLAEMSRIGLPVPPGFTITTEVCTYYYDNKKTYPKVLEAQARNGIAFIENIMGTKFGDKEAMPLLVSCAVRVSPYWMSLYTVKPNSCSSHPSSGL